LLKEFKYYIALTKPIIYRVILIILSGLLPEPSALLLSVAIILFDIQKNKLRNVLIVFLVLLLFSDSQSTIFSNSGKNAKDIVLVIASAYLIFKGKINIEYSYLKYFLAYLIIALIGLIFVNFNIIGLQKWFSYGLIIWFLPVMLLLIFERGEGLIFLRQMIIIFALLYIMSIVLSRVSPAVFAQFGRFNGIHRNPNGVGIFSALFVMNLFLVREKVQMIFSKKFFYALVSIFLFAIILSGSRNSILALSIFFIFSLFRIKFFLGLTLVVIISLGYNSLMVAIEQVVLAANLEKELRLNTLSYASGRIYIWQACWMEIQNNYWLGHGFSYEEYSKWDKAYYKILPMLIHNYGNIHNSYLTIWLNTGLLGLLSFMIGLISNVLKNQFKSKWFVPLIFATIFLAFFESFLVASLNPYTWQLWFALFMVAMSVKKPMSRVDKNPKEDTMAEEVSSMDEPY
jgi:O-antigen ligase